MVKAEVENCRGIGAMTDKDYLLFKRQVVALCMESPLYLTMPLRIRLDFIKKLERQTYWIKLRGILLGLHPAPPA